MRRVSNLPEGDDDQLTSKTYIAPSHSTRSDHFRSVIHFQNGLALAFDTHTPAHDSYPQSRHILLDLFGVIPVYF